MATRKKSNTPAKRRPAARKVARKKALSTPFTGTLKPLAGTIDQITFFGVPTDLRPNGVPYDGKRLFARFAVQNIGSGSTIVPTLGVIVDENPPTMLADNKIAKAATLSMSFRGWAGAADQIVEGVV